MFFVLNREQQFLQLSFGLRPNLSCCAKGDQRLIFCQGDFTCSGKTQLTDVYLIAIINQCNVYNKILLANFFEFKQLKLYIKEIILFVRVI